MELRIECLCLNTPDPDRLAQFWQAALGWRRCSADEGVLLQAPDGRGAGGSAPQLLLLPVPRDAWEQHRGTNRFHLDLRPEDQDAEVARLESLGATRVDVGQGDVSWVVLADPDGNELCVLGPVG